MILPVYEYITQRKKGNNSAISEQCVVNKFDNFNPWEKIKIYYKFTI